MTLTHLVISVTFLQPTCHARSGPEEAAPNEWPPSPLRLFQAMVAGVASGAVNGGAGDAGGVGPERSAALRWFEGLCGACPPRIWTPPAVVGQAVPRYVPSNTADVTAGKWVRGDSTASFEDRTRKVFRPTHLLGEGPYTVHYVWPLGGENAELARVHEAAIRAAARSIVALGWGVDAAVGDARLVSDAEVGRLGGERWVPGRGGGKTLRVPVAGTLDHLAVRHAGFVKRLQGGVAQAVPALRVFGTSGYRHEEDLPERPFAAFILRPVGDDSGAVALAPTAANRVAAMVRHVACIAARGDLDPDGWRTEEWSLRCVAGHGPAGGDKRRTRDDVYPRLSYLALPTVGHPHADGMIRRVMVAEPHGGDGRTAAWVRQRLAHAELIDEATGEAVARLDPVEPDEMEFGRVFRLYAARGGQEAARRWVSVTPVLLPRHPKARVANRERLVAAGEARSPGQAKILARADDAVAAVHEALEHAGINPAAVERVEIHRAAQLPKGGGALTAPLGEFRRPSYLTHLPAVHVRLVFRRPFAGPLALGAGRHAGLGVLAIDSDT